MFARLHDVDAARRALACLDAAQLHAIGRVSRAFYDATRDEALWALAWEVHTGEVMGDDGPRLRRRGYGRVDRRLYYRGPLKRPRADDDVRTPEEAAFERTNRCAVVALSNLNYRLFGLRVSRAFDLASETASPQAALAIIERYRQELAHPLQRLSLGTPRPARAWCAFRRRAAREWMPGLEHEAVCGVAAFGGTTARYGAFAIRFFSFADCVEFKTSGRTAGGSTILGKRCFRPRTAASIPSAWLPLADVVLPERDSNSTVADLFFLDTSAPAVVLLPGTALGDVDAGRRSAPDALVVYRRMTSTAPWIAAMAQLMVGRPVPADP